MYKIVLLVFIISLHVACNPAKKILNEGVIAHKHLMYDSANNEIIIQYEEKDMILWFRDSTVIMERLKLYINTDEDNKETWYTNIDKYTYLDLRTMIFYDYKKFSDTSTLIRRYTVNDSVNVGWNFYRNKSMVPLSNDLAIAQDTIIKNISYSRLKGIHSYTNPDKIKQLEKYTYYMRCDKKNTIFHVDKPFDDHIKNCPVTRFDYFIPGNLNTISTQYEYVSDTLTKDERKVFDQWAKNAKTTRLPLEHSEE